MEEMNKLMKDVLEQRMLSYVDCFGSSDNNLAKFFFKGDITEIIYNHIVIKPGRGSGKFYMIRLQGRYIDIINDSMYKVLGIDVANGYIELYPVEGNEQAIEIKFVEFRHEQKTYNESHIVAYPLYGLELQPVIYKDTLMYNIIVRITMSPVDDKVFKITHLHLMDDTGIDGAVDTATNLYNMVLSKDFVNFFEYDRITKTFGDNIGKVLKIIEHRYSETTFLVVDENGIEEQLPYLYYFNNMITPVGLDCKVKTEFCDETEMVENEDTTTGPDDVDLPSLTIAASIDNNTGAIPFDNDEDYIDRNNRDLYE